MLESVARLIAQAPPVPADATADDAALARALAHGAGQLLLRVRADATLAADPKQLRDTGDQASQHYLAAELDRTRPDDAVLSEESADRTERRLGAERVWIIDPLDGTREFGEPPRADWAVHVALWQSGRLVAGAVALPGLGQVLSSAEPPVVPPAPTGPVRLAVSRTRPPEFAARLAEHMDLEQVPMGSAGAKVAAVVLGDADLYVHAGGQYEWDSAAPVAVAAAAGLHTSRVDGSPLEYNQPNPWLPDLVVCRPELAPRLLDALDAAAEPSTNRSTGGTP